VLFLDCSTLGLIGFLVNVYNVLPTVISSYFIQPAFPTQGTLWEWLRLSFQSRHPWNISFRYSSSCFFFSCVSKLFFC